jgi:hypothetical protein
MLKPPFQVLDCSWPRPVAHDGRWHSAPEWDAPRMPFLPQPAWESIQGEICWAIDWCELFRRGVGVWDPSVTGEMRGFHVVFRVKIAASGPLIFWDDDGSIIRRRGVVIHEDVSAHPPRRSTVEVEAGDVLEVAHWQWMGEWIWAARFETEQPPGSALLPYRDTVLDRLRSADGPPLKLYTDGRHPVRAALAVYSLVLNGYRPAEVILFGDYQWSDHSRHVFRDTLPFATIVPYGVVSERVRTLAGMRLVHLARHYWWVMKALVALLMPPAEFCLMDDDVFILGSVADALEHFQRHDLVYAPDTDHGAAYRTTWGWLQRGPCPSHGMFNAGLYWMRNTLDPRTVAVAALRVHPRHIQHWVWEQGLISTLFARNAFQLPTQRYFYPLFDGLPGGPLGYDYALNPCGFASIHFGGLTPKPGDEATALLAPEILDASRRGETATHPASPAILTEAGAVG